MKTNPRIAVWVVSLKLAVWVMGFVLFTGGIALAAPLPGHLTRRVELACQRAHEAGLMHKVDKIDRQTLLALTEAPCVQVRAASVYVLGEIREARATARLIARLGDEDKAVRRISARALGKIGDPAAAGPLAQTLENREESLSVRCVAAHALGMLSDLRAAQALLKASRGESEPLRNAAANALHNMKGFLELRARLD